MLDETQEQQARQQVEQAHLYLKYTAELDLEDWGRVSVLYQEIIRLRKVIDALLD